MFVLQNPSTPVQATTVAGTLMGIPRQLLELESSDGV